jgi:hypothetical protein
MSTYIEECIEIVEEVIPAHFEFYTEPSKILIETNSRKISSKDCLSVGLWAQSQTGSDVLVDMMLPRIRRFLRRLADNGAGAGEIHDEVLYRFIESTFSPNLFPVWTRLS